MHAPNPRTAVLSGCLLLAALAAAPAVAAKAYVDWDREYDFGSAGSFAWSEQGTPAKNEINQRRIERAVGEQLEAAGLRLAATPVDLLVVTHASVDAETRSRARVGIGIGRSVGWGGISVGGSRSVGSNTVEIGTLVIQILDRESGNLVWEARISDTLTADADKLEKKIRKAVAKAFKNFPR